MRSRAPLRYLLAGAALAALGVASACTVLLDGTPDLGDRCTFEGEVTTCGRCLIEACQPRIDACCGGACGDLLAVVDACAPGGDLDACAALKGDGSGGGELGTEGADLVQCAQRECDAACPSARPVTRCTESYDGCSCEPDRGAPDATTCDVPLGGCCADAGWPAEGTCSCVHISCASSDDDCECDRDDYGTETSCDDRGFAFCCITSSGCECRNDYSCEDFSEDTAAACAIAAFACGEGQTRVDHCHATEDDLPEN